MSSSGASLAKAQSHQVTAQRLHRGGHHFLAEEAPDETYAEFRAFFAG